MKNSKFDKIVYSILDECASKITEDKEYMQIVKNYNEVFTQLEGLMTDEQWTLINKIVEMDSDKDTIINKEIYKQGLHDGVQLSHILNIT